MTADPDTQHVVSVAVGRDRITPPNPYVALGLALLVGAVVFAVLWWARKTFGLKR